MYWLYLFVVAVKEMAKKAPFYGKIEAVFSYGFSQLLYEVALFHVPKPVAPYNTFSQ
jgi:hypothetical protein